MKEVGTLYSRREHTDGERPDQSALRICHSHPARPDQCVFETPTALQKQVVHHLLLDTTAVCVQMTSLRVLKGQVTCSARVYTAKCSCCDSFVRVSKPAFSRSFRFVDRLPERRGRVNEDNW